MAKKNTPPENPPESLVSKERLTEISKLTPQQSARGLAEMLTKKDQSLARIESSVGEGQDQETYTAAKQAVERRRDLAQEIDHTMAA